MSDEPGTVMNSMVVPLPEKFQHALKLHQAGQLTQAQALYEEVLAIQPGHADAINLLGAIAIQTENPQRAVEFFSKAIEIDPGNLIAHCNRGLALWKLKQFDAALASYDQAIAIRTDVAEIHFNRGNVLRDLRQLDMALASYKQAIAIEADYAEAYLRCGNLLHDAKQWKEALVNYDQAIATLADYEEAHLNRGIVLRELKQWEAALASFNQAIALKADYAEGYANRGLVFLELRRWEAALASFDQAIALKADYAEAYSNRGIVLKELRQWGAALASFDQAIALKVDYAEGYSNRGIVLRELEQLDAALISLNRAIALKADFYEAYVNRGNVLKDQGLHEQALSSYEHALALKPDEPWLYGNWLHTKMHLCDWNGVETAIAHLAAKIERAERAAQPYEVLTLIDSARLQRRAAETWAQEACRADLALPPIGRRVRHDKIRLGYYSPDFRAHAMAYLTTRVFEQHDKDRFHIIAFSFGPDEHDDVRRRLSAAFTEFIDVRARTPKEIAQLSRELQIDIAVDLNGFTAYQRPAIFAHRAAPVQVSYLGYPGTMGAPCIDYIMADRTVIPEDSRRFYAEQIVYLPHSYYPNSYRDNVRISDRELSRAQLGLPTVGCVFCCFNNRYKITPGVFDIWMRILRQVEGSVLWFLQDSEAAVRNLRKEARARGVSEARLIFAPRVSTPEHLARHRAADLFIDTLPYNAHTTATDALWAGLPVLTLAGESFAARVAASLLDAVGLPELITTTAEQYEATAISLATDPARLARIRDKLDRYRLTAPLFDSELLTRHLEQAYVQMHQRSQQGLSPQHIVLCEKNGGGGNRTPA